MSQPNHQKNEKLQRQLANTGVCKFKTNTNPKMQNVKTWFYIFQNLVLHCWHENLVFVFVVFQHLKMFCHWDSWHQESLLRLPKWHSTCRPIALNVGPKAMNVTYTLSGPLLTHSPLWRAYRTTADGCGRLRTVANIDTTFREHSLTPRPPNETGTLATHSGTNKDCNRNII